MKYQFSNIEDESHKLTFEERYDRNYKRRDLIRFLRQVNYNYACGINDPVPPPKRPDQDYSS